MTTANKKDLAVVAITKNGARIGRMIKMLMPEADLYVIDKFAATGNDERLFSVPTHALIDDIAGNYRKLVLIMAVGIAVRLMAPHIKNKGADAGVAVVDDSGKFAISLLSGHVGGANELAEQIASLIGAQAVVTTASDARGFASLDMLVKKHGWAIDNARDLTRVSAALVNDEEVALYQDAGDTAWSPGDPTPNLRQFSSIEAVSTSGCEAAVIITDKRLNCKDLGMPAVVFYPKSLVVGIGCNRGTPCSEIEKAISAVFSKNGLSMLSIKNLATADLKRDEAGLLEFARKYGLPVKYFTKERLAGAKFRSKPSPAALKHAGVPSVSEAAAILGAGSSLIVPKTAFNRQVTVAVARSPLSGISNLGKLFIVGIGPGDPTYMTIRARQAISESEAVVGYKTYIDLCRPLLAGKQIISNSMGKEIERVNQAISLATHGKNVSLISSGDAGIYGMAGLAVEILEKGRIRLELEVVPGVPAVVSAAALLGAPLNVDVASISLSDHLVQWNDIARRLECAAQSDFVIALYNPKSKARKYRLAEARDIVLKYRPPSTPVGIVSNAYRPGQDVRITDLLALTDQPVDMDCMVIIGNSSTHAFAGRIVTPRGYSQKYTLTGKLRRRSKTRSFPEKK